VKKRFFLNSSHVSKFRKKKALAFVAKVFTFVFLFLFSVLFIIFLFRLDILNIKNIQVLNNKTIKNEVVEEIVRENIAGHYLKFFPKTSFLFYPKEKIENDLKEKIKNIKEVSIEVKNLKVLEINILEREAKYAWCGEVFLPSPKLLNSKPLEIIPAEECHSMDEYGYIFEEVSYIPENTESTYFKFYGPTLANKLVLPDNLSFKELISLRDQIEALNIKLSSMFIKSDGDIEFYILLDQATDMATTATTINKKITGTNPKIIFKIDSDLKKALENLQAALTAGPLSVGFEEKYSSLIYIDLRFDNKVFYKFTQGK
jgi:cell division septal protein FtsQ